jgi:hypothetical protein
MLGAAAARGTVRAAGDAVWVAAGERGDACEALPAITGALTGALASGAEAELATVAALAEPAPARARAAPTYRRDFLRLRTTLLRRSVPALIRALP